MLPDYLHRLHEAGILWISCPKVGSLWPNMKSSKKVFPDLCLLVRVTFLQADNGNLSHVATPLPYKMAEHGASSVPVCTFLWSGISWTQVLCTYNWLAMPPYFASGFANPLSLHWCLRVPLFHDVQTRATHLTAHITPREGVSIQGNSQIGPSEWVSSLFPSLSEAAHGKLAWPEANSGRETPTSWSEGF